MKIADRFAHLRDLLEGHNHIALPFGVRWILRRKLLRNLGAGLERRQRSRHVLARGFGQADLFIRNRQVLERVGVLGILRTQLFAYTQRFLVQGPRIVELLLLQGDISEFDDGRR